MTKPNIQIDDVVREMTDKEYESFLADEASAAAYEAKQQVKVKARKSAFAKLAALGLTEEEIAAL
jgi:hypothetical protein